jgi:uncharacterized membrane protein YdjX (TVP38/TMEM64 family)/rhodanese-related sulfurtransferase
MNPRNLISRAALVSTLAAAIIWLGLHRKLLQSATIERELHRFGACSPILFLLLYALATVLFVPGSVLTMAGGAFFGPIWGTLWNLTGATLGAALAFAIARYIASDWVSRRAGDRLARLVRGVEEEGWRFIAFVRLVPLFPFNLMNYAFGLTRIRLRDYILASFVCMAPGAIAYTYLGYAGREAAAGSAGAIRNLLITLGLLAAVGILPRVLRRQREQSEFIETAELKRRLEHAPQPVMIDVRGADEFGGSLGHIRGARKISLSELGAKLLNLSTMKQSPLVLVCKTDKHSAKAAELLREAGFEQVSVLRGRDGAMEQGRASR